MLDIPYSERGLGHPPDGLNSLTASTCLAFFATLYMSLNELKCICYSAEILRIIILAKTFYKAGHFQIKKIKIRECDNSIQKLLLLL